jgi:probable phosphoglycerate mutase
MADLLATSVSRPLVVTHNTLLRLFLCDALGLLPSDYRRRFPIAEHCAVTELSVSGGTVALLRFNAAL